MLENVEPVSSWKMAETISHLTGMLIWMRCTLTVVTTKLRVGLPVAEADVFAMDLNCRLPRTYLLFATGSEVLESRDLLIRQTSVCSQNNVRPRSLLVYGEKGH